MKNKIKKIIKNQFSLATFLSACLSLSFSSMSYANDTTYGERNGSINFEINNDISMEYERLYISPEKITVDYLFRNQTDEDITVNITFPMPPENFDENDRSTIENYQLFVEGQPVTVKQLFTVKTAEGKDITQELIKLGWDKNSLVSYLKGINEGSMTPPPFPTGPHWDYSNESFKNDLIIQDNYVWQQTFKANSLIHISHHYKPSLTSGIPISIADIKERESLYKSEGSNSWSFCLDNGFEKSLEAKKQAKDEHHGWDWDKLEYVLTTGNNWKGPIKNFNLVIEKSTPEQLISLCFDGDLKKTSPTRFEFNQVNFEPKEDLRVLFIGLYK